MSEYKAYRCDECDAEKRQANHWFLVRQDGQNFIICVWDPAILHDPTCKHVCGQLCITKMLDRWLTNQ